MIRMCFVGDVGLARRVPARLREDLAKGLEPAFVSAFERADLTFCNLELPFCNLATVPNRVKTVADVGDADLLTTLGFDVVSLANNHIADAGAEEIELTRRKLTELNVAFAGAGANLDEAVAPVVLERHGVRIGLLAFCEGRALTHHHIARHDRAGAAPLDSDLLAKSIRALRPEVDILIASLHQGVNYVPYASPRQRGFAHEAARAGADLVIGHHPHVLQGWEELERSLIFYSLGEFLWDPGVGNVIDPRWDGARRKTAVLEVSMTPGQRPEFRMTPFRRDDEFRLEPIEHGRRQEFDRWLDEVSAIYADYDPGLYLESAASGVTEHTVKVLWFNLRRGNFAYLLGAMTRIRGRHLRIALAHLKRRLGMSLTRKVHHR